MNILDQWEAEAKEDSDRWSKLYTSNSYESANRILALIELVRKKDQKLDQISAQCLFPDTYEKVHYTAKEARALTEELKCF